MQSQFLYFNYGDEYIVTVTVVLCYAQAIFYYHEIQLKTLFVFSINIFTYINLKSYIEIPNIKVLLRRNFVIIENKPKNIKLIILKNLNYKKLT